MNDATTELKLRARILQRSIQQSDPRALKRLALFRTTRRPAPEKIQRKHCLDIIAQEFGFKNFPHASGIFSGTSEIDDFGSLLNSNACTGLLSHWFADYQAAHIHKTTEGGYLLGFRTQFIVTGAPYIEALGLDPDDSDWAGLDYDWVRPSAYEPRARLYAKLLAARTRETQS